MGMFELINWTEEVRRSKLKWYQRLWENISPFVIYGSIVLALIGIGILIGKYIL